MYRAIQGARTDWAAVRGGGLHEARVTQGSERPKNQDEDGWIEQDDGDEESEQDEKGQMMEKSERVEQGGQRRRSRKRRRRTSRGVMARQCLREATKDDEIGADGSGLSIRYKSDTR